MQKITFFILVLAFTHTNISAQESESTATTISKLNAQEEIEILVYTLQKTLQEDPESFTNYKSALQTEVNTLLQKPVTGNTLHFALDLCNNGLITLSKDAKISVVGKHQRLRVKMKPTATDYHSWIWDDEDYGNQRYNSGVVLDLLGHGSQKEGLDELKASIEYFGDCRLKAFAVKSLVTRQKKVAATTLNAIAADDEARSLLFDILKELEALDQFPKRYYTQKALSKSNMVNWLIYPTELGRVPTEIVLVQKLTEMYDDVGAADFYIWKFKSDTETWKEDGWMAGISGAYARKEGVNNDPYRYTFSAFEKLSKRSPREHLEYIVELIEKMK